MSTKNVLGRPWVEFVLGVDQVIKGFDRALPQMSVGERSTIDITAEYACKSKYVFRFFGALRITIFDRHSEVQHVGASLPDHLQCLACVRYLYASSVDGKDGLPPHIPPNSALRFDLTLLGFRARCPWVKPLIQDHTTCEKPYHADLKIYMEMITAIGIGSTASGTEEEDQDSSLAGMKPGNTKLPLLNSPGGSVARGSPARPTR